MIEDIESIAEMEDRWHKWSCWSEEMELQSRHEFVEYKRVNSCRDSLPWRNPIRLLCICVRALYEWVLFLSWFWKEYYVLNKKIRNVHRDEQKLEHTIDSCVYLCSRGDLRVYPDDERVIQFAWNQVRTFTTLSSHLLLSVWSYNVLCAGSKNINERCINTISM